jgi:hypothetical protein
VKKVQMHIFILASNSAMWEHGGAMIEHPPQAVSWLFFLD